MKTTPWYRQQQMAQAFRPHHEHGVTDANVVPNHAPPDRLRSGGQESVGSETPGHEAPGREIPDQETPDLELNDSGTDTPATASPEIDTPEAHGQARPSFEVLVVDRLGAAQQQTVRDELRRLRRPTDKIIYETVFVRCCKAALRALLHRPCIQACLIRYGLTGLMQRGVSVQADAVTGLPAMKPARQSGDDPGLYLGRLMKQLRPEVAQFLVVGNNEALAAAAGMQHVDRVFASDTTRVAQHRDILAAIERRFRTPFFDALRTYSRRPIENFHALPIARGKSLADSQWVRALVGYFGINVFMADSSATCAGLDSLHQPRGQIKQAQQYAARAFGAGETLFVTDGTSAANKIVLQALLQPGDVVLIDRNCHKSHHYGLVQIGARVDYLDAYPLNSYGMYGAVPLRCIKQHLLAYKAAGRLADVKLLVLTNCTFDGIVYNVRRVMEQCLAIKPDLAFLWDEAWFAFATFHPLYRTRTAMGAARTLHERYGSAAYRREYAAWQERFDGLDPNAETTWLEHDLLPDPERVRIRVYASQSTHKTLSALRQGSMIHVFDPARSNKARQDLHDAYMMHTTTSPSYPLLACLDVARMQAEVEGFKRVYQQLKLALALRRQLAEQPLLNRYFHVLTNGDMVPAAYRQSGLAACNGWAGAWRVTRQAWDADEFVLDPTRVTLAIDATGVDGNTFKTQYLMGECGIQVNKTTHNTVLFMAHIGTSAASVATLIAALARLAGLFERQHKEASRHGHAQPDMVAGRPPRQLPPLPDFSRFHTPLRGAGNESMAAGDIRRAYFLARYSDNVEYLRIDNNALQCQLQAGREVVSASFVTPYPPGFPVLVPGQVINQCILRFLLSTSGWDVHGYCPGLGLEVFRENVLFNP